MSTAAAQSVQNEKIRQAREKLDAHTREVVAWHFDPDTGTPFWLEKAKSYSFNPLKEVAGFDDGTVIAIPCNMTGGSSGGPWLISINGTFGYVNGHNDFKYNNDPGHMYSPYYDGDWFTVFNSAQNS